MEYLKNCVYKYMSSNELSEKKRLYPVICTLLKLTNQEKKVFPFDRCDDHVMSQHPLFSSQKKAIEQVLCSLEEQSSDINHTLNNITAFASTSLESLWGFWG